jgi:prolipoprotein diacylglyceryl transferase
VGTLIASIPSPSSGELHLGPLTLHLYGLTLLVAIVACIWLTGRRWVAEGGTWDLVWRVSVWGVAFGVIGARAYHDVTSWNEVPAPKWKGIFEVWQGGLGIWGGILLGTLAGAVVIRRAGFSVRYFMDAAAPGLLLAQGIGRIGNWWNQELYGKPSTLPWALKIDVDHRPTSEKYANATTFQPTFLYELLWDVAGAFLLIWVGRRFRIKPPGLFALYVSFYTFGRFFEELIRIDPAHHFLGLRLNAWVSAIVFVCSSAFFVWWQFYRDETARPQRPKPRPVPRGPKMAIPRGRVR